MSHRRRRDDGNRHRALFRRRDLPTPPHPPNPSHTALSHRLEAQASSEEGTSDGGTSSASAVCCAQTTSSPQVQWASPSPPTPAPTAPSLHEEGDGEPLTRTEGGLHEGTEGRERREGREGRERERARLPSSYFLLLSPFSRADAPV